MPYINTLPGPIRVVIADDHEISRIGIRRLLSTASEIEIIAEASHGAQCIDLVSTLKPHVVLLDVMMPGMSGIQAVRGIKNVHPDTFIIMLSAVGEPRSVKESLIAGADGYLSKEVGSIELIEAIHNVVRGERVFSRTIIAALEGAYSNPNEPPLPNVALTQREEDVVILVAKGLTSQEIAKRLFISPRTVETHRARIMDKLGVSNAAGLVRFAILHQQYFDSKTKPE